MTHLTLSEGQTFYGCQGHTQLTDYTVIKAPDSGDHLMWCACGKVWAYDGQLGALQQVYDFAHPKT